MTVVSFERFSDLARIELCDDYAVVMAPPRSSVTNGRILPAVAVQVLLAARPVWLKTGVFSE